jgi:hypothetical protein
MTATKENTVFLTVDTYADGTTAEFRRTAKMFQVPIINVTRKWETLYDTKIVAVLACLHMLKQRGTEYVFLLDSRDLFFINPVETILEKFNRIHIGRAIFNKDIPGPVCHTKDPVLTADIRAATQSAFTNLNAGAIAGSIDTLITIQERVKELRAELMAGNGKYPQNNSHVYNDDQFLYQVCLAEHPEWFQIDTGKQLFALLCDLPDNPHAASDNPHKMDVINSAGIIHCPGPSRKPGWHEFVDKMIAGHKPQKKVLSYSLFQIDPKETVYIRGLLAQKELVKELYPGWTVRVHVGDTIDKRIVETLHKWGWETVIMPHNHYAGLFWRFLPFWDESVDIWLCKDTDELLSYTYRAAEIEWENSDKGFFCMKWEWNGKPIIPGDIFGAKRKCNEIVAQNIRRERIDELCQYNCYYSHDESWLINEVKPLIEQEIFLFELDHRAASGEQYYKNGLFYCGRVIPPFDSMLVRHNVLESSRMIGNHHDNLQPYYQPGNIVTVERFDTTEKILADRGLKIRSAETVR